MSPPASSGNYWDETAYATPPLDGLDRVDPATAFDWLGRHFPVSGTKIDWRAVRAPHESWTIDDDMLLTSIASREVCRRVRRGSVVEHVGDSLSPYGVRFAGEDAARVVAALLEIPEHHYFLAEDRSWVVVVTTEGHLDVVDEL